MNQASIVERCKGYTQTAVNLLKHPFHTIRYLLTLDGGDYLLYAFPIIVLTIYNGILTTLSRSLTFIPGAERFFFTTGIWSTIVSLTLGYVGWRIWMYILWSALQFVGGTGKAETQRLGLLHITLAVYLVQMACSFVLFLSNVILGFTVSTMLILALGLVLIMVGSWNIVVSVKFLKELNNISYGKTILGMLLPTIVCLGIFFFAILPLFH